MRTIGLHQIDSVRVLTAGPSQSDDRRVAVTSQFSERTNARMSVRQWSSQRRLLATVAPLCLIAGLSLVFLSTLRVPFPYINVLWGAGCLWVGFVYRSWQRCGINLAAALFTLSLAEAIVRPKQPGEASYVSLDSPQQKFARTDDLLGLVPRPNARVRHTLMTGGEYNIDATYTIDENSLRVVVPPGDPANDPVVFCGCSYTFGEGVEDNENLPSQVARRRPDLRVLNFGFSGYGPHQMLANLESGRIREISRKPPRVVIYQMIPPHVKRVVGWVPYRAHAPRYGWREGKLSRLGHHDDRPWLPLLQRGLAKSGVYSQLLDDWIISRSDIELTAAVVEQSATEVARQFPGCEFHVLFWSFPPNPIPASLAAELKRRGLKLHMVEDFAPEIEDRNSRFKIPGDGHPNAEAYSRLADYICQEILTTGPSSSPPSNGHEP